ncbi:voltage-dependent calcium channel [Geosmithia morbida]|uniref:Calcium-channel protein CCH1 n=1 Tax=Geosmithia morbida TaxID=1094350 RepID=A0A9P5D211_9HYPO|nr:voltage-dependent calcium channel [Geosmithia morbida]KAF4123347.1 voltage-dependent calcium channel [Geosmithia morbida]
MSSDPPGRSPMSRRQSIPLQSLGIPGSNDDAPSHDGSQQHLESARQPQSPGGPGATSLATVSPYWDQPYDTPSAAHDHPSSPIDVAALQSALPPAFHNSRHDAGSMSSWQADREPPYMDESPNHDFADADTIPLTSNPQHISGALSPTAMDVQSRDSFQTVSDLDNGARTPRDTLHPDDDVEFGRRSRRHNFGLTLAPDQFPSAGNRSRSPSVTATGALQRAGSIVRAMSQRVVNISGDAEIADQRASMHRSRSPNGSDRHRSRDASPIPSPVEEPGSRSPIRSPGEKGGAQDYFSTPIPDPGPRQPPPNPLKGRTLNIFEANNPIRLWLCDLLVKPYTEPLILLLIILQTVLLTIESASNVFTPGHERPTHWGHRWIDWAMLGLFIVFTLELIGRIIVSGFFLNAAEYSTIDRSKGIRAAVVDQYRSIFQPHNNRKSAKVSSILPPEPATISRSFTTLMQTQQTMPETLEEQQRFQLARRAFLRHSFNRLDFLAVCSFWMSLILSISGIEHASHFYLFRMLSCLRILRLLAVTHGTSIILRSLKKAAPLLVRVAFLILFFWLVFAIIGVQSFKSSLSRQCVWLDPLDPTNMSASYTNEDAFCGGYRDNNTGAILPWVTMANEGSLDLLVKGTEDGKGFICPRGSICLQQQSPNGGTVNFDDIAHSFELVFVIMSANTFSDLMYNTMGSDYSLAALFFGAGIMIMTLWLVNLLIAVILSSFQVIREESKASAFTGGSNRVSLLDPEEAMRRLSGLQRWYNKTRYVWVGIIAFNLLSQALRSTVMPPSREAFIRQAEIFVTIMLDVDIILRLITNRRRFHKSRANLFDLFLAIVTSVILIPPIPESEAYRWLTVFQILRVYRVILAIPVTRKIIMLVLGNAAGIANLTMFVFLMTFLMAILAAQLFRGEIPIHDDGELNRVSFYTIYNSFLGMYQILTSENWTDILYLVGETLHPYNTAWIGIAFLVGWFIVAFFVLVNMFIAVIQENFDVSEDEKRLEQVKAFLQKKDIGNNSSNLALSTIFGMGRARHRRDPLDYGPAITEMLLKDAVVREFLDEPTEAEDPTMDHGLHHRARILDPQDSLTGRIWNKLAHRFTKQEPNPFYTNTTHDYLNDTTLNAREMAKQAVTAATSRRRAQREYLARHPTYNVSLYLFAPHNKIRRLCQRLVGPARGSERFDGVEPNKFAWYIYSAFIYAIVVAMVIIACITTPLYQKEHQRLDENPSTFKWYVWTDLIFSIVFTIEAVIKTIADGLISTPNAYLRSSWGFLDSIVLITLWINVGTLFINDGAISRAVGAFKALRALRLLNVSNSARDTFHSVIIMGWWKLFGAAVISISLLIPFAVYGLNLFGGMLVKCNDGDNIIFLTQCFGEFNSTPFSEDWPMLAPRVASNPFFDFDDFASSLFVLFQIVSQEGWVDVSFTAQSITGKLRQPSDLASQGNAIFFVVFNLLATIFILTLFISVFMRNYTEQTGMAFLTAEQRSWLELRKLLRQISPSKSSYTKVGHQKWKQWCHKRATEKSGKWYQGVTLILVLHFILLIVEFAGEPFWWTYTRIVIFLLFIFIYIANIFVRIVGLGWSRFRRSSWDLYSLFCVSGAFITTAAVLGLNSKDTVMQLHKVFLVSILFLIIPRNDALDQLFKTAAASLPVISNLLATWLVLFLVFAIASTQAFSLTRFGEEAGNDINFRSVPKALILLFRTSFGEGWNAVMEDFAAIEPPLCVDNADFFQSDCGSKNWARFLFIAWNILSMYIFVNLFVSLIYESFSYVYQRSSWVAAVDRDEIRRFKEAWRSVDPAGTGAISKEVFPRLLSELSGVFQMRIYDGEDSVHSIMDDSRPGEDEAAAARANGHNSIVDVKNNRIDVNKLNQRLDQLDVVKIREKRRRFKIFYEEVLVSADPDRGITFTSVLMILAHYNIIKDSKSLKLDEFLRRRARLQRVEESVRRKTVQGFFDTLYWTRRFKKHMEAKRASRMTTIPQLDIPDIFVDDNETSQARGSLSPGGPTTHLSVQGSIGGSGGDYFGSQPSSPDSPSSRKGNPISWHGAGDRHPLSFPRSATSSPSPPGTPLGMGFDALDGQGGARRSSGVDRTSSSRSRTGSVLSPTQASDMLEDSIWLETIRRSTTIRRPPPSG